MLATAGIDGKEHALGITSMLASNESWRVDEIERLVAGEPVGDDEQLTEALVYFGLTVFTACFLNYAQTELDVPMGALADVGRRRSRWN